MFWWLSLKYGSAHGTISSFCDTMSIVITAHVVFSMVVTQALKALDTVLGTYKRPRISKAFIAIRRAGFLKLQGSLSCLPKSSLL